tara:strand:- start:16 stop:213 length:198 start_codon:yes stop_codon:yes gene_type:complete
LIILLRNGVGISDLRELDIDDASALLELILDDRDDTTSSLSKFLKSKKGSGVQAMVDISIAGRPY